MLFTLGDNMPAVSYDVKSEDLFKEIKSEEGRVFLVRSGTSYYYHCDSDDELKHIPSSFVEEIKIDKGNTRRVQLLSAKFKKKVVPDCFVCFWTISFRGKIQSFSSRRKGNCPRGYKKILLFSISKIVQK